LRFDQPRRALPGLRTAGSGNLLRLSHLRRLTETDEDELVVRHRSLFSHIALIYATTTRLAAKPLAFLTSSSLPYQHCQRVSECRVLTSQRGAAVVGVFTLGQQAYGSIMQLTYKHEMCCRCHHFYVDVLQSWQASKSPSPFTRCLKLQ
jgi:hypothetical protein